MEQYLSDSTIKLNENQLSYVNTVLRSVEGTDNQKAALKSLTAATKATSIALNILNTVLTSLVITVAVKAITSFVNQEREIADIAKKATDRLNDQKKAVDDYASRIEELYKKINSGQLTLDEHVEANRELREIQQELIDNFGSEAQGIDLVTQSLEEQEAVLKRINNLKSSDYLRTEWENSILNEDTSWDKFVKGLGGFGEFVSGGFITDGWEGSFEKYSDIYDDYRNKYHNRLEEMVSEYEDFSATIEKTSNVTLNRIIETYDNVRKNASGQLEIYGNVEDVKDTIVHLQTDYKKFPGYTEEWANSLSVVWKKADDIVSKYGDIYHTQIQLSIASNEQYVAWQEQLQDIYKKYEEATISGDDKTTANYASQYKDLVNQIRQQVQSTTYQNEIIGVVPSISDVDYENFKQQIDGILNSEDVKRLQNLDVDITLHSNTADLYQRLSDIYDRNKELLNEKGISSVQSLLLALTSTESLDNGFTDTLRELGELFSEGEALLKAGTVTGKKWANGVAYITDKDLEDIRLYSSELFALSKTGEKTASELAIAYSNLVSEYGENFVELLGQILTTNEKMDWQDWLNEPGFLVALEKFKADAKLEEWQIKEILTSLGLIESDTRREVTNQVENFLRQSFGDVELSEDDLFWQDILVKGLMNSWDESDLNLLPLIWEYVQVPEGTVPLINDLVDALNRYKESLEEINQEENPFSTISDSVKNYTADIKPWIDDLGSAYDAIFNGENGFDIEVVDDDLLNNIRSQFEAIQQAFAENGIADAFDTQALEDFLAVLSDDATTAEEAQAAFNAYATSLFYSAEGLKDLNAETANSIKQMLQKSGVENYEEVVENMLNYQKALEYVEKATLDLTAVDEKAIVTMITKGEVSEAVGQKIAFLALQEQIANSNNLNTDASIDALMKLAGQAGIAEEYLIRLEKVMQKFKAANAAYANDTNTATHEMAKGLEQQAKSELDDLITELQLELNKPIEIKIPKAEGTGGGGGGAGKEAADEYLEAFNGELENLDWLHENGYLNEKEYLDQLRILYERYFKDNDKYAKEFFENQRKYLEGLKDLYENVLSAITSMLDDELDKIEELEDAEKKELEDQKKANDKKIKAIEKVNKGLDKEIKALEKEQKSLQKQNIDPIDERIKGQEEIKKGLESELSLMQKQNEERESAINLQKAEWELEKARNQRNILVDMCQTL